MTDRLRPYATTDLPPAATVPVSVIVLTRDEAVNIGHCLRSLQWASQIIVVDSGSADDTTEQARALGADVITEPWRGFGAQREFALRLPELRHEWVYFADADEWVSPQLAAEIATTVALSELDAYSQRRRLIFQDRWVRHCGWYKGSWQVRLMRRGSASFDGEIFGERACIRGITGRLQHDLVDEDRKGLAFWLRKHVGYAELEAGRRRRTPRSFKARWRAMWEGRANDSRPLPRAIAKDLVLPMVPARPLVMFAYMYVVKAGFLDGAAGLRFCLYHAWFQLTVDNLAKSANSPRRVGDRLELSA